MADGSQPDLSSSERSRGRGQATPFPVYPLSTGADPFDVLPKGSRQARIAATVSPDGSHRYFLWNGTVWIELTSGGGGPFIDHDHTATGDGGILSGDKHDTFSEYIALGTPPATPSSNRVRVFAETFNASALGDRLVYKDDQGLYHLLQSPPGEREVVGQGTYLGYIGVDAEHNNDKSGAPNSKIVFGPYYCANDTLLTQGFMRLKGNSACKMLIYSDTAGAPDALVGSSAEITLTDAASRLWYEFAFTGVTLQGGTSYWIGLHSSTAFIYTQGHDSEPADFSLSDAMKVQWASGSDTYAGGASNPFGAISSSGNHLGQAYVTGLAIHTLLNNGAHSDTVNAAPVRGDLMIGDSTPKWGRLPIPSVQSHLTANGADPVWIRDKLNSAATDPSPNDDVSLSYAIGSRWIRLDNDKEWVCTDASLSAAVWKETTNAAGGVTLDDAYAAGRVVEVDSGVIDLHAASGGEEMLQVRLTADSTPRWWISSDGYLLWGDGTNPYDTLLFRVTPGVLRFDAVGADSRMEVEQLSGHGVTSAIRYPNGFAHEAPTELTLNNNTLGAVTANKGFHRIDTNADAASGELATINGLYDGGVLLFRAENAARTIVVKNTGGNIVCATGADITLDETYKLCYAVYDPVLAKVVVGSVAGGGGGGGGGGSSKHQYVFVPDAPVGVDVATGAQTMFHVSTAADEPLVRILVFAATAHSTNTFTITLEQYQNAGAGVEDITATGTWTTIKAITTTANVKFKSDTAPAATIKARGALRINITGTPTGWNGITVVYEVTRTTV